MKKRSVGGGRGGFGHWPKWLVTVDNRDNFKHTTHTNTRLTGKAGAWFRRAMRAGLSTYSGDETSFGLPTLPHALLFEVSAYLWPGEVARLASTARRLGTGQDGNLVTNALSFFRPSKSLPGAIVEDLITNRLPFCKALRVLDLSSAVLTPQIILTLGHLAATEGRFQTVCFLNLWDNSLGNEGCLALSQALELGGFRTQLQGLYVRANNIGDDDFGDRSGGESLQDEVAALCRALESGACAAPLTSFSLAQNELGSTACLHIGRALAALPLKRLRKLDLHLNRLGERGAVAIAEGLSAGGGMPCLDEFYLGFNGIGDGGARAVANCLVHMPVLRELDMASNLIGNEGALALAVSLAVDTGGTTTTTTTLLLESLDLRGNRIGDDGACAFRDYLAATMEDGVLNKEDGEKGDRWRCPNLANIFFDSNRGIRTRGREALQALHAARGIICAEGPGW